MEPLLSGRQIKPRDLLRLQALAFALWQRAVLVDVHPQLDGCKPWIAGVVDANFIGIQPIHITQDVTRFYKTVGPEDAESFYWVRVPSPFHEDEFGHAAYLQYAMVGRFFTKRIAPSDPNGFSEECLSFNDEIA